MGNGGGIDSFSEAGKSLPLPWQTNSKGATRHDSKQTLPLVFNPYILLEWLRKETNDPKTNSASCSMCACDTYRT